ncbi:MAG: exodeoxyribonuclease III [Actinobacteria bacterium]|nr:exodeoxyribonuclease III [Actinomycetota bacterium]MCB9388443.1 exodeoxyribonuclease III [Acidimicrobiia bacterium]
MRIATWNVNSLRARLGRVQTWLDEAMPDVLCLQETKLSQNDFPTESFASQGYESIHVGQGRWNGVAILSKVGLSNTERGFGGLEDPTGGEARIVTAQCGPLNVVSVYVPNGRELGHEQYDIKLAWLDQLRTFLSERFTPGDPLIVTGDFNIAPDDRDVWSPKRFAGKTHVSQPERDALQRIKDWGLTDIVRDRNDEDRIFTFWDYRMGAFHRGWGMRIDLHLVTKPVASATRWSLVDTYPRRTLGRDDKPSDHTAVFIDIDTAGLDAD